MGRFVYGLPLLCHHVSRVCAAATIRWPAPVGWLVLRLPVGREKDLVPARGRPRSARSASRSIWSRQTSPDRTSLGHARVASPGCSLLTSQWYSGLTRAAPATYAGGGVGFALEPSWPDGG